MAEQRAETADIILFSAWRPPAPPMLLPNITVIESTEELRKQLAASDADEYSRPASLRLLGHDWPVPLEEPAPHPAWQGYWERMDALPADVQIEPDVPGWFEWLWPAIVMLLGLFGALTALATVWPH